MITDEQLDEWERELAGDAVIQISPTASAMSQFKMERIIIALIKEIKLLRK